MARLAPMTPEAHQIAAAEREFRVALLLSSTAPLTER